MLSFFQQLYLFWRDSDPINVKYVFFSTTTSTAIIHVCGRTGKELIFNIAGHVLIRFKNFQFIRVTDNDDFLSFNSGKGYTVYIWRVGGFGVLYDGKFVFLNIAFAHNWREIYVSNFPKTCN